MCIVRAKKLNKRRDRIARASILAATVIALLPLALIIFYLLRKGLGSWSVDFFTTDPTGNTFFKSSSIGGIKSAILGTLEIVALAAAIAIPVGIGVAVWLVEFGRPKVSSLRLYNVISAHPGVDLMIHNVRIHVVEAGKFSQLCEHTCRIIH